MKTYGLISTMSLAAAGAGSIPIPFVDAPIVLNILSATIISIGKFYGYVWKKISINDLMAIYRGDLYNPNNEPNHNQINSNLNREEIFKLIFETFFKGALITLLTSSISK